MERVSLGLFGDERGELQISIQFALDDRATYVYFKEECSTLLLCIFRDSQAGRVGQSRSSLTDSDAAV
jgi:hypothetical protein